MPPANSKSPHLPSRRALAPGLLSLFAPALLAGRDRTDVTIKVGGLFSLTGNSSDLGTQSKLMLSIAANDMQPMLEFYNANGPARSIGVGFEFLIEDTKLDPQTAANAATSLIAQGAQFLIGPQTSSEVTAVKPITDQRRVALISQGSTASSLSLANDSVFRFVPDDTLESKGVAQAAASLGIKAIVPVWRGDDGNRGLVNSLKNFAAQFQLTVATGFEYATSVTDFTSIAASLESAVSQLKSTYTVKQIAIFMAGFDEAAGLLVAAAKTPDLGSVRWFAGDGITLSNAFLTPDVAPFAAFTQLLAPSIALPAEAQPIVAPVLAAMAQAGVASPTAFAFAAYDAMVCATMAYLLAGNDKHNVAGVLPQVAQRYFGTTGWTLLNAHGDRAVGNFQFFGIALQSGAYTWIPVLTQQVS
jgi:branched-chain amino acid transport system substrate-binding protein